MQQMLQMLELHILIGCCLLSSICSTLSLPYDPLQLQDVSIEENAIDNVGREMAEKAVALGDLLSNRESPVSLPEQQEPERKQKFGYRPWELEYYKPKEPDSLYQQITEEEDDDDERGDGQQRNRMYMNMKRQEANETSRARDQATRETEEIGEHALDPYIDVERAKASNDIYFIVIVAACCAAAVVGVVAAGICWYRFQRNVKATADAEYPAYGVTGPTPTTNTNGAPKSGDRKLAQYAHMYHYQHQKQQMIAMESKGTRDAAGSSDIESDEDNGENDDTVYECPGLAPTGELEVKNPLFEDEPTPLTPAVREPSNPCRP